MFKNTKVDPVGKNDCALPTEKADDSKTALYASPCIDKQNAQPVVKESLTSEPAKWRLPACSRCRGEGVGYNKLAKEITVCGGCFGAGVVLPENARSTIGPEMAAMVHSAAKLAIARGMPVCEAANGTGYLIDIAVGPLELISRESWDPARLNAHSFNLMNAMKFNVFHTGGNVYAMESDSDGEIEVCASYADHEGKEDRAARYAILKLCCLIEESESL